MAIDQQLGHQLVSPPYLSSAAWKRGVDLQPIGYQRLSEMLLLHLGITPSPHLQPDRSPRLQPDRSLHRQQSLRSLTVHGASGSAPPTHANSPRLRSSRPRAGKTGRAHRRNGGQHSATMTVENSPVLEVLPGRTLRTKHRPDSLRKAHRPPRRNENSIRKQRKNRRLKY